MKRKSLGINAVLNAFKSALSIIFPLITYPYAFRILHAAGIGKVNYANSIVSYFSLIAALGISTYAVREGAKLREDRNKFETFCSQMFSFNLITTLISYMLLFLMVTLFKPLTTYESVIMLLSLTIAFTTIGIEWINTIYEDFLFITIRSIVINLISLVLLFLLVKTEDDYMAYALLTVVTSGCICLSNWIYCRKYVHIKLMRKIQIGKHIKPILTFFVNNVATSIYVNADTTMLGFLVGDSAVGLYALAVKVYNVIKTMLAALYTVAVPRIAYYVGQDAKDSIKSTFTSLFSNLTIILFPASIGLISISKEIVLVMGGQEYAEATRTLQILAFALIGAIIGGAVTYCLNIPLGREKITAKATMLSAIINIVLNFFAIPLLKQNGAALTTAISEFFVAIYCIVKFPDIREYLDINMWVKSLKCALMGCFTIIVIAISTNIIISSSIIRVAIVVVASVTAYAVELVIIKNPLALTIMGKVQSKLKNR